MVKQIIKLLENPKLAIHPVRGLEGISRPGRPMSTMIGEFEERLGTMEQARPHGAMGLD